MRDSTDLLWPDGLSEISLFTVLPIVTAPRLSDDRPAQPDAELALAAAEDADQRLSG